MEIHSKGDSTQHDGNICQLILMQPCNLDALSVKIGLGKDIKNI